MPGLVHLDAGAVAARSELYCDHVHVEHACESAGGEFLDQVSTPMSSVLSSATITSPP
jgi:hypothetical protein